MSVIRDTYSLYLWSTARMNHPWASCQLGESFFRCLAPMSGAITQATRHLHEFTNLQKLLNGGEFHHATYRNIGTVWEGLWFYAKDNAGHRGFCVAGCINKDSPFSEQAHQLVRHTGVSVGSYGQG